MGVLQLAVPPGAWDCVKEEVKSLRLSRENAQFSNKQRKLRGKPTNPSSLEKMAA